MKSKISFFNKTIFKKNMTLYWPIWGIYTLLLLFFQPVILWISEYNSQFYNTYTYGDHLENLISVLSMNGYVILIAVTAVLLGMALFSYMYNSKSANMIHALPVDRTQLFCTNVISGLTCLIVPQILSAIITCIVSLSYGVKEIHYVGIWLLLSIATDFVSFAFVTFCAMFTGQIVALPIYVLVVNYLSWWVYYIISVVITVFGYGVNSIGDGALKIADILSPLGCFMNNIGITLDNNASYECVGAIVFGQRILCGYLVVAVILYVVSYVVYKKRHIEQAGEFITVGWVKSVFRFGVGFSGGFFGSMIIREMLLSMGIGCGMPVVILLMIVLGALSYFVADMLVKKSFHVFKKKNWMECGIFIVTMLACFIGLYHVSNIYEDYVPDQDDVRSATICLNYDIEFEEDELAAVYEIHNACLEYKEFCETYEASRNWNYDYVTITYHLKNGDYVRRSYILPYENEDFEGIYDKIHESETDVDNYMTYLFCKDYEDIEIFNGGWFEAVYIKDVTFYENGDYNYEYETITLTSEQAKELYEAILADVKAGTLTEYTYTENSIMIEYKAPNGTYGTQLVMDENSYTYYGEIYTMESVVEYSSWDMTCIYFGPDCENIINKLIEFGFIESEGDIWWVEQGECVVID